MYSFILALSLISNGEFCDPPYDQSIEGLKHKMNSEIYYIEDYLSEIERYGLTDHNTYYFHNGKLKAYKEVKNYLDKVNSKCIPG